MLGSSVLGDGVADGGGRPGRGRQAKNKLLPFKKQQYRMQHHANVKNGLFSGPRPYHVGNRLTGWDPSDVKHPPCSHLCPRFQAAMEVLAKPWNGLIMATLAHGTLRFSELSQRLDAMGDRMLSGRLKEL